MTLILGYTVFLLIMNDLLPSTANGTPLIGQLATTHLYEAMCEHQTTNTGHNTQECKTGYFTITPVFSNSVPEDTPTHFQTLPH